MPRVTTSQTFSFDYTDVSGIAAALAGDLYTLRLDVFGTATFRLASLENTAHDPLTLTVEYRPQQVPQSVSSPSPPPLMLAALIGLAVAHRRARHGTPVRRRGSRRGGAGAGFVHP